MADAQHTEQLATLSRRRSEVRVSALEEMRVLKCFVVGVLLPIFMQAFTYLLRLEARKNTERHPHYASYVDKGSAMSRICHAGATSPIRHPPQ